MPHYLLTVICISLLAVVTVQAQDTSDRRELRAYPLQKGDNISFDGRLDEAFWDQVEPATGFRMQEPREGAEASEKTEVRIAYDSGHLYIGAVMYDSEPSKIKAYQRRRDDRMIADERFTWIFDTFNDQRTAYFMEVNPNGMRTDGLVSTGQGGGINLNWDGIWDARTHVGDYGWSAEVRIPFRTFNFDEDSETWGVNFLRVIRRKNETVLWSGFRRNQGIERPQDAGILTGLRGMSQGLGLEVIPYSKLEHSEEPIEDSPISPDAGFDVNYSITPSLKASFTVNTDFAEAEVDERQINLSRFPLFFPEQRDFFLEGASIYSFAPSSGIDPYFSRRIGLIGGEPIPITYGARLLGNVGDYNMALLHVRTGKEGDIPPEDFTVGRVKKNIGSESTIGLIYTRRSTQGGDRLVVPLQDRHTIGGDLELGTSSFLGDQNMQFQAFFVYHNSPFAETGPADFWSRAGFWDRTSRGLRLNFPNQPWSGHVSYREFGEAFDPALGFTQRRAFRRLQPSIAYTPQFQQSDLIQQVEWGIRFEHLMDLDFDLLTQDLGFTLFEITFMSGEELELGIARQFEHLEDPFDIRRDSTVIIPEGDYTTWRMGAEFETASFRRVSAELNFETGGFWSGTQTQYGAEVNIRPLVGIDLSSEYVHTQVNLAEGDFATDLIIFEANVDLTTSFFITTNLQYDNLSEVMGTNNRLRWIITPGSDLYLVYNHNWLGENSRFNTFQRNAVIKVSYTHRF